MANIVGVDGAGSTREVYDGNTVYRGANGKFISESDYGGDLTRYMFDFRAEGNKATTPGNVEVEAFVTVEGELSDAVRSDMEAEILEAMEAAGNAGWFNGSDFPNGRRQIKQLYNSIAEEETYTSRAEAGKLGEVESEIRLNNGYLTVEYDKNLNPK